MKKCNDLSSAAAFDDVMFPTSLAANYLAISSRTMIRMRSEGSGPRYFDLRNRDDVENGTPRKAIIRYRRSDLEAWRERRRRGGETPDEACRG